MKAAEADRAARHEVIDEQGRRLGEVEAERNNLRAEAAALRSQLEAAEADRAARLEVIHEQGRQLGEAEAEREQLARGGGHAAESIGGGGGRSRGAARSHPRAGATARRSQVERNALRVQVEVVEAGRLAHKQQLAEHERRLEESEAERRDLRAEVQVQLEQIQILLAQLRALQRSLQAASDASVPGAAKAGRWKFMEHPVDASAGE